MAVVEHGLTGEAVVSNRRHPDLVVWLHFRRHSTFHKEPERRDRVARTLTAVTDRTWPNVALPYL
jgi:hypothetical protein